MASAVYVSRLKGADPMKNKLFVSVFAAAILVALAAFVFWPMPAVQAGPAVVLEPVPADVLNITVTIMLGFASLYGVSKLIAALINLLKLIGVVKDGTSAKWAAAFNLAAFVGLVLLGVFRPDLTTDILDGYAGQIAGVLLFLLGFLMQIVGSKSGHDALSAANVPLIGTSYSKRA
jgi:hypothetical protein